MGYLSSEILKDMKENGVKQIDFMKLTGGTITQSQIAAILRGVVPKKPHQIDIIAKTLGRTQSDYRELAALDIVDKELKTWGFNAHELYSKRGPATIKYKLPVFKKNRLQESLSQKGYPKNKPDTYIEVPTLYGKYAYGVSIEDSSLFPRVFPGETIIISQDFKTNPVEDYAVVRTKKHLFIGCVRTHTQYLIVEVYSPYKTEMISKKDILFYHKIIGIYSLPIVL